MIERVSLPKLAGRNGRRLEAVSGEASRNSLLSRQVNPFRKILPTELKNKIYVGRGLKN